MPLMIVRADRPRRRPAARSPPRSTPTLPLLQRLEALRLEAGRLMGLGDVSQQRHPEAGARQPRRRRRQHHLALFHAAALPCVACRHRRDRRGQPRSRCRARWPAARSPRRAAATSSCCIRPAASTSRSSSTATAASCRSRRAALLRTARKIMQGELHIPDYVYSRPDEADGRLRRRRRCTGRYGVHRAAGDRPSRCAGARRGGVAFRPADHARRADARRRRQRHHGACHRAAARPAARPADR